MKTIFNWLSATILFSLATNVPADDLAIRIQSDAEDHLLGLEAVAAAEAVAPRRVDDWGNGRRPVRGVHDADAGEGAERRDAGHRHVEVDAEAGLEAEGELGAEQGGRRLDAVDAREVERQEGDQRRSDGDDGDEEDEDDAERDGHRCFREFGREVWVGGVGVGLEVSTFDNRVSSRVW